MKIKELLCSVGLLATSLVGAGTVVWQAPQDIVGDADVSTNGVSVYAFSWGGLNPDTVFVNGQGFIPCGVSNRAGVQVEATSFGNWDGTLGERNWVSNLTMSAVCSTNYLNILKRTMFSVEGASGSIFLRQLVPGRRYEVQLWMCSCFPDMLGAEMTLDGVCTVKGCQGTVEAVGVGQQVRGTFVCPASGEQEIAFSTAAPSRAFVNALQVRDITGDAIVAWEAHDIIDDADVSTEGTLLYAYAQSGDGVVVNGVPFAGVASSTLLPKKGNEDYCDLSSAGFSGWTASAYTFADLSENYGKMVQGGIYADRRSAKLTLCRLVPGRTYLVQLWVHDSRTGFSSRRISLDGRCTVNYQGTSGTRNGQYALGRFTAIAPKQTIDLFVDESAAANQSAQWNAVQVRQLTPTPVAWEPARAVTSEADVSVEGQPLYAYYWGTNENLVVNGVTFAYGGPSAGRVPTGDITTAGFSSVNVTIDFIPNWKTAGLTENLYKLLCHGVYGQRTREVSLTLNGLEPGARYLVQIFSGDGRVMNAARATLVDGLVRLYQTDDVGKQGNFVLGRFTATDASLTLPLRALAGSSTTSSECSPQFNAIQVRKLEDAPSADYTPCWEAQTIVDETDVATDGTLKYAYCYAAADQTVNGVTFKGTSDRTKFGDDVAFAVAYTGGPHRAFDQNYNGYAGEIPTGPYRTLLACGAYDDNHFTDQTFTLRKLEVGHTYLVQMWAVDLRDPNNSRRWTLDGQVSSLFRNQYVQGRFTASTDTQPIAVTYYQQHCQLNALQVRDLGPAEGGLPVEGGTLALESDLTTNAVYSTEALTVSGPKTLDAPGGVFAPAAVINAPWSGSSLIQAGLGTTTLNGAADALERVTVQTGTLVLNGAVSTTPRMNVYAAGRLAVGADASLAVATMEGEGVYAGPGTITLANNHQGKTVADLADGLTIVKTGAFDWFFTGALDGATINVVTGRVVIADGVKTGTVGFAGDVRFLDATVAGALTATDNLTTEGLVFGEGASLTLPGTAELHEKGALDLDGVTVNVGTARRPDGNVLIRADGALTGTPTVVFQEKGFKAVFDRDLNAWCSLFASGTVIYIR